VRLQRTRGAVEESLIPGGKKTKKLREMCYSTNAGLKKEGGGRGGEGELAI